MKKLYTFEGPVRIPSLGILGPIKTPYEANQGDVVKVVRSGGTVYMHNPYDLSDKVKVTVQNINTIEFTPPVVTKSISNEIKSIDVVEKKDNNNKSSKKNRFEKRDKKDDQIVTSDFVTNE